MKTSFSFNQQKGAVLAFVLVMLLLLTLGGTRMIQQNKQQLEMANNARLQAQEFANAEGKLAQAEILIGAYAAHNNWEGTYFPDEAKLIITHPKHQCTPIMTMLPHRQDIMPAGPIKDAQGNVLAGAFIVESKCMSLDGYIRLCSTYDEATGKTKVYPRSNPTGKELIPGTDCASTPCTAQEIAAQGFVPCSRIDTSVSPNKLYCGSNDIDCTGMNEEQMTGLCSNTTRDSTVSSLSNDVCYQRYDPQCTDSTYESTNVTSCSVSPHECPVPVYRVHVVSETATTVRELLADMVVRCGS